MVVPLVLNKLPVIEQFLTQNIFSIPSGKTLGLSGREDINLSMNSRLFTAPSFITLIVIQGITEFMDFVDTLIF
jgi:hypothetical protein